jgi:hypothetical protein
MKNLSLLLLLISISCAKKAEPKIEIKSDSIETVKPQIVGNDADEHGCKPSAGYTWSVLKNECVQVFNAGTRLNHTVSQGKSFETSAFVIFDDGNKAELFLDNGEKPFILERKSAGKPWINGDWELSQDKKDYILKQKGEVLFSSK